MQQTCKATPSLPSEVADLFCWDLPIWYYIISIFNKSNSYPSSIVANLATDYHILVLDLHLYEENVSYIYSFHQSF